MPSGLNTDPDDPGLTLFNSAELGSVLDMTLSYQLEGLQPGISDDSPKVYESKNINFKLKISDNCSGDVIDQGTTLG